MQWFKHDSSANTDVKLKRLRMKYGLEGYGLYWYCLELIAASVTENRLTFELEHDAEVIAHDMGMHSEVIQEMMRYMIDLGLFENNNGTITCIKMAQRLDQSMTSNPRMREMIKQIKQNHDAIMTNHDSVMQEEKRRDKKRIKTCSKSGDLQPRKNGTQFDKFWQAWPVKRQKKTALEIWKRKKLDESVDELIADVSARLKRDRRWKDGFIPNVTTYLNQHRWEDEYEN